MPNKRFTNPYSLPIDDKGFCLDPKTGKRVCGAERNGGTKGPCYKSPMPNGRCNFHGGATPNGIGSPHYEGRGYSKYLPTRLKDDFGQALESQTLTQLTHELALIETRLGEVLRQLGTGESSATWQAAQAHLDGLIAALQAQPADPQRQGQALRDLSQDIKAGARDAQLWREVQQLIDGKRRLVQTENQRLINAADYVPIRSALILFDALIGVVIQYVTDRAILAAIQDQWNRVTRGAGILPLDRRDTADAVIDG